MSHGRVGGLLVIGGWVLLLIALAAAMSGGAVGIGAQGAGSALAAASMGLVGIGAAVLSAAGPRPLGGRLVRVGLGLLGVGLLSLSASSVMAGASAYDPLESVPLVALLLIGLVSCVLGALITGLMLLGAPGPSRGVGVAFLTGVLLLVLASIVNASATSGPLQGVASALCVLGCVGVFGGGVGLGVLGMMGGRPDRRVQVA